jgi:hypothetical protein
LTVPARPNRAFRRKPLVDRFRGDGASY